MYFSNSHPSLDLPTPAGPLTDDEPRHASLGRGVEQLLDQRAIRVTAGERRFESVDAL